MSDENVLVLKLLLVGDSGVGKSSILVRYTDGTFSFSESSVNIGVDFKTKEINTSSGKKVTLSMWDTAGQEKFRALTSSYYRGTHGILVVFDICKRDTFESLGAWLDEIQMYAPNEAVGKVLVGNKIDLSANRLVSQEEALSFANSRDIPYLEASAKDGVGISRAFESLVDVVISRPVLWNKNLPPASSTTPSSSSKTVKPKANSSSRSHCKC